MKNKVIKITEKTVVAFFVFLIIMSFLSCKNPIVRPGDNFNGSVKWALQIAQPEISSFSSDAQIYSILGALIWKDGRLPDNTGTWSFVSWSFTLQQTYQVTIDHQGNVTESIRDNVNPPNTGSGGTLPAGWVNSTAIFASIPIQEITKNYAQLVVFNTTSYSEEPNTAVWGINFAGGKNPLVRWDGVYIGTQLN